MALFIVANSKAIPDYMYETKNRNIAFCNSCFEKEAVRQLKDFVNEAVELASVVDVVKECLCCRKEKLLHRVSFVCDTCKTSAAYSSCVEDYSVGY